MAAAMRSGAVASAPARLALSKPRALAAPRRQQLCRPVRAIDIDLTDFDTQVAFAGIILGIVAGIGAPIWYINRVEKDEERLDELRALNRANFDATGEYMTDAEIAQMRKPKWTDRREWQDDD